jgi:hypothetical protein
MLDKRIVILDIAKRLKVNNFNDKLKTIIRQNDLFLSLTPYSSYILSSQSLEFSTFHTIISKEEFKKNILLKYKNTENILNNYIKYSFILRHLMMILTHNEYINVITKYIENMKINGYEIIYITDRDNYKIDFNSLITRSDSSLILINKLADVNIIIKEYDNFFYLYQNYLSKYKRITNNLSIKKIVNRIIKKNLSGYDNKYLISLFKNKELSSPNKITLADADQLLVKLKAFLCDTLDSKLFSSVLLYLNSFKKEIDSFNAISLEVKPNTFLSNTTMWIETLYLKDNYKSFFTQHGNYIYQSLFINSCEIIPASTNFVLNDYTNKQFKQLGAKNVYTIGSINFNKVITEEDKKYDYIYITSMINYMGHQNYIDSLISDYTIDGDEIYNRHKNIIELFINKFSDKTICIKVHPGIVNYSQYVPFWELSYKYDNITIDATSSIHTLIEESKYIISDYFSSEFINRELHYKRDIIVFKSAPLPLPEETLEDMDKMFILVDTVNDLEDKIINIESITKNRKRYDDIIEYYSSKKCDTKKVVTEILEKELNGR